MIQDETYYIDGVLSNNRRIIAKTITLIESSHPEHQVLALNIVDKLLEHTGNAARVGITGVPGAGKSTFIESLGITLARKNHKVAVLAVDPSSQRSGGSIMADKTRMEKLATQTNAFIRPSPSSGTLGGVARKTRESMLICEAAGYDVIIVETVGVGQSETTVASMVDFFLVLMLSGAGDEIQGIKRGVLELADAIVVNKADGDNVNKANMARRVYETALHLLNPPSPVWRPPVLTCSALEMKGITEIWDVILDHNRKLKKSGEFEIKRKNQALEWMWTLIEQGLKERFKKNTEIKKILPEISGKVKDGSTTPTAAAHELLFFLDNKGIV